MYADVSGRTKSWGAYRTPTVTGGCSMMMPDDVRTTVDRLEHAGGHKLPPPAAPEWISTR